MVPAAGRGRKAARMDFESVRAAVDLKRYAEANLEPKGRTFVCPSCGSGTKRRGTPAFSISGDRFKCFSCGAHGDVFDLAGIVLGTDDRHEQYRAVCEFAGIPCEDGGEALGWDGVASCGNRVRDRSRPVEATKRADGRGTSLEAGNGPTGTPEDRSGAIREEGSASDSVAMERAEAYVERVRDGLSDPRAAAYVEGRGFTTDEARAMGWGFDPSFTPDLLSGPGGRPALVIPYGPSAPWYAVARYVGKGTDEGGKYGNPKGLPKPRVTAAETGTDGVLWVVEGLIDAWALRALGHRAVSLNGVGNAAAVAAQVAEAGFRGSVVVLTDYDERGEEAASTLRDVLGKAGIPSRRPDGLDGAKDAGELLARDRGALAEICRAEEAAAAEGAEEQRETAYAEAMARARAVDPYAVVEGIMSLDGYVEPVPTGLEKLDAALGGGLYPGLCVLGAISSMGKTTLMLQIADHMAASGRPVLFVTIEQTARELVARSISRVMWTLGHTASATSVFSRERDTWPEAKRAALDDAAMAYAGMTRGRLVFLEGTSQPSVRNVRDVAARMREHHGVPPVVFIDYLQLLAPVSERDSDRKAVDRNVTALRQLAGELGTPVVVISSLNRSSYSGSIEIDSFKESGGIEYGADVLLGLQPLGMADAIDEEGSNDARRKRAADRMVRETKAKHERACEVVILKNRNGGVPGSGAGVPISYIPVSNIMFSGVPAPRPPKR